MGAAGEGPVDLTGLAGDEIYPAWSPDGSRLAFLASEGESFQVTLVTPDGLGELEPVGFLAVQSPIAWRP